MSSRASLRRLSFGETSTSATEGDRDALHEAPWRARLGAGWDWAAEEKDEVAGIVHGILEVFVGEEAVQPDFDSLQYELARAYPEFAYVVPRSHPQRYRTWCAILCCYWVIMDRRNC